MKKIIFLIFVFLIVSSFASACYNSADDYAVEVILTKPGIISDSSKLEKARNVFNENGQYYFLSEYGEDLGVILSKAEHPSCEGGCASLRLQIPVNAEKISVPYLIFSSTLTKQLNITPGVSEYKGWKIFCDWQTMSQCEFKADKVDVLVNSISGKYQATIEINYDLEGCAGCNGKCLYVQNSQGLCINNSINDNLEDILKFVGLIENSRELFYLYRIIGEGDKNLQDLQPSEDVEIDWEEAMRQELVWLRKRNILQITNQEIEEISSLSKQGKAGHNSAIVYALSKDGEKKWLYYYESMFPSLIKIINCGEVPQKKFPEERIYFPIIGIAPYYLIPIGTTLLLVVILILLIIGAKLKQKVKKKIEKKKGRRKKNEKNTVSR